MKQGIASWAGAYFQETSFDPSSFTIYGSPRGEAKIEAVEDAIDSEVRKIVKAGVADVELEKAKTAWCAR